MTDIVGLLDAPSTTSVRLVLFPQPASGERRRREGGNIFEDKIRVGVAIYFLVRRKGANGFTLLYNAIDDYAKSPTKTEYIRGRSLTTFDFSRLSPDSKGNWLNHANTDFDSLVALANRQTKLAKKLGEEQAVFGLYSMGILSARDEWIYDFNEHILLDKVTAFCETYQSEVKRFLIENPNGTRVGDWVDRSIKWTSELETHLINGDLLAVIPHHAVRALFRPFLSKYCYYAPIVTHRRYQMPQVFPHDGIAKNKVVCFCVNGKQFYVLASDKLVDYRFTGDSQCLPFYRYTEDGRRVSNITEWGLQLVNDHYRKEWGKDFENVAGKDGITAEQIFAYTYAVLHDPVYRHDYAVDLLREFPRLPLYHDFDIWARMGQELLDLHIGFEPAEPYPLEREESGKEPGKPKLRAYKEHGVIVLDDATRLTGVPPDAWRYRLGSRSAIEWVLDQYKERKPKDPTIAARFNTYHFADHKERVIDLLRRVCTVSVKTMEIVDGMAYWDGDDLVVYGDRDKHEWAMLGMADWAKRSEGEG